MVPVWRHSYPEFGGSLNADSSRMRVLCVTTGAMEGAHSPAPLRVGDGCQRPWRQWVSDGRFDADALELHSVGGGDSATFR